MRSSKKRIDYSMFNSSGEKVIQSTDMTSCDTKNDTLLEDAEIQTLSEDITFHRREPNRIPVKRE